MKLDTYTDRLIPALPPGEFVLHPEEIDRFVARLLPDGTVYVKGTRERIEEFLAACAELGLMVRLDYVSLCG